MRIDKTPLEAYIESNFVIETDAMKLARQRALDFGKEGLSIGPSEGALISFLIQLSGAQKIVEIGTFTGYSGLWLLNGTQSETQFEIQNKTSNLNSSNTSNSSNSSHLFTIELREDYYNSAKEIFKLANLENYVSQFLGPAKEKLQELKTLGPFDAVFIDANKNGYLDYLTWAYDNLKIGGLIIADNTLLSGLVYDENIQGSLFSKGHIPKMQKFNQIMGSKSQFESILIPTREGLTVGIKK